MTRAVAVAALVLAACAPAPRLQRGAQCELNSQCDAPLVCRLSACRKECATTRDCGIGQQCVLDAMGLGACTLDTESHCAMNSDCPAPLVCASTRCVNACNDARDCHDGAMCIDHGCVDPAASGCVRDSECAGIAPSSTHFVCANDGRCRPECETSRDCRFGTQCDPVDRACKPMSTFLDGGPSSVDGGIPDGSGTPDGGSACAGPGMTTARAIAIGNGFVCTVVLSGDVYCWGSNATGVLGEAAIGMTESATPVRMTGVSGAHSLTASYDHVCASVGAGRVLCWGSDTYGQLGDGATTAVVPTPVSPVGLPAVVEPDPLVASPEGTCALAGGRTWCWGNGSQGALGDGTTGVVAAPALPTMVPGVAGNGLAAWRRGACAFDTSTGATDCWGANASGQAGSGAVGTPVTTPTAVPGTNANTDLESSDDHVCVIGMGPGLLCWGSNTYGELGDGTFGAASTTPVMVPGVVTAESALGSGFTCALSTTGVRCWGRNDLGQLGDGTTMDAHGPRGTVVGLPASGFVIGVIVAGPSTTCVFAQSTGAGTMHDYYCWGSNAHGELGPGGPPPGPGSFSSTAVHQDCLP